MLFGASKPDMSVGTMTLYRFNGQEAYAVESATIGHYKDEDSLYAVTFRAETGGAPVRTLPDIESLRAQPFAEITLRLPKPPALALIPGRTFSLPEGYDKAVANTAPIFITVSTSRWTTIRWRFWNGTVLR